jgi:hypothetical protein
MALETLRQRQNKPKGMLRCEPAMVWQVTSKAYFTVERPAIKQGIHAVVQASKCLDHRSFSLPYSTLYTIFGCRGQKCNLSRGAVIFATGKNMRGSSTVKT